MDFIKEMKAKAKDKQKKLVLPEGTEPRTIKAARIIADEELASLVTLLGRESEVKKIAAQEGVDLSGVNIINPESSPQLEKYANTFYELRKHKGMTPEQAKTDMLDTNRWGAMMVYLGEADALVSGAEHPTADVLRAGLTIIGTVPGVKTASSCFVMTGLESSWGVDGALIFSDCAVVPDPTAEQLADIAESAALSCREFLGADPVVALMSFSTKGSAKHDDVAKVQNAVNILKDKKPDFLFDGELQADAALVPSVTDKKAPGSPIRGKVNTLIFPNLGAGNIGYKLVQRLGKAEAFGPFLQGFAKPISDLSRGASVDDIVVTCAVTLSRTK
ncbi:phosphate acetyltransferase [Leadbettera azotonutricia]|uniref:Phosphate acetyltransferase n=1 Tax=Leadbettera azotonutricia (strain ATCC BAA-888 / DSM 13862 / ZAS-9) TaxID=545695 RepID=F5Y712_LEAAZ|nr:phosphate acetyltransferase [Leadbettera azotonutricia]AEF82367.1 phosphate acetyltransferase [Leadbettera azotonutricia ZAS-9]